MKLYRCITYQSNFKVYDSNWSLEVNEENYAYLVNLFRDYLRTLPGLRYLITLEVQYAILWQYHLSDQEVRDDLTPYFYVVHCADLMMPRYYRKLSDAEVYIEYAREKYGLKLSVTKLYKAFFKTKVKKRKISSDTQNNSVLPVASNLFVSCLPCSEEHHEKSSLIC